ncbi:uncharacterized protein LOC124929953 [Impatiens glandulifera]|uniref:uncharacterized protein LOC124929953 n=1 Tax=Impatiens glandulifera TaxID=253017 RepID=UPI001FB06802|nr:uncharacterized protein LOC124929953 [Impatiens glandulifera]
MDLPQEQLQFLHIGNILDETIKITAKSPKTFLLVALTLILPLSLAILCNSIFTFPLFLLIDISHPIKFLFIYEIYHIILIVLAILSTSAVVFISASIYTSKPVSFLSTMSAIPNLFSRLFKTFLCISLLMSVYNLLILLVINLVTFPESSDKIFINLLFIFFIFAIALALVHVQVYITALCFMASAVSVLEPVNGFSAFKKSYRLLKGKTMMVFFLTYFYVLPSVGMNMVSGIVVFADVGDPVSLVFRIVSGGFLVAFFVLLNLGGLVTISVLYYVCKSYHCETIDKTALFDHLEGYLGEYVPLMSTSNSSSTIQMEIVNL